MPRPEPLDSYLEAARLLGEKVRALREDRGLTQEELAHRTGIARNQIQNIEHNRNNVKDPATGRPGHGNARLDTIFRLAHELGVDVTYLIDPARPVDPLPARSGQR
ncbi:MAG: helix-turn-helix transcriptional regulator [Micropruina sp.]